MTTEWLLSHGFLPDGEVEGEYGFRIWGKNETESPDCSGYLEPAMQILVNVLDQSVWLESYGNGGEVLCLVELPGIWTSALVLGLLYALGQSIPSREEVEAQRKLSTTLAAKIMKDYQ